jgi:hypothetical protein
MVWFKTQWYRYCGMSRESFSHLSEEKKAEAVKRKLSLLNFVGAAQSGGVEGLGSSTEANPDFAGEQSVVETEEVMQFHQDGTVVAAERQLSAPTPEAIRAGSEDLLTNDIIGFLRRPVHLFDFVWHKTDPVHFDIATTAYPRTWLDQTMVKEKLQGFRYLRCKLKVQIQINAQPMNAGGLILWFNPLEEQLAYNPSSFQHLGGRMGYPHVIYRCGEATAIELTVPFFGLVSHFDLVRAFGAQGVVRLSVISALTGSDDVDGACFVWAEDIDVSMPTGHPLTLTGLAQAGAAAERKRPGNVETTARALAGVASTLSSVPVIGDFAKIGNTVLGAVGGVASMFGWSKPADPEFVMTVNPVFARHMGNYNGDSKTKMLALDTKNTTNIPTDIFNTTEDEMSFRHILNRPVYIDRFKFAGTASQGTLLWSWPAEPGACNKTLLPIAPDPTDAIQRSESYLSYLSTCAMYWRGGLKYHLKCFKTSFHSGRLRLTYVPGAEESTVYSSIDLNKCYSRIYDLRADSDIEFTIPYTYFQPWKPTEWTFPPSTASYALNKCYSVPQGMIYVSVLNALRNPTTVESEVEFLALVSADDDFQFAVPYANNHVKVISRAQDAVPSSFTGRAQSGQLVPTTKTDIDVNAASIGEAFTGFRQWLKRYHPLDPAVGNLGRPFQIRRVPANIDTDTETNWGAFDRAYQLYRFYSGAMRLGIANYEIKPFTMTTVSGAPFFTDVEFTTASQATGQAAVENTFLEPFVEFEIPFYQMWPALMTGVGNPSDQDGFVAAAPYTTLPYNRGTFTAATPFGGETFNGQYYRSIGEDFSFGFLIGVPLTCTRTLPAP